jgi:hypothetical protein
MYTIFLKISVVLNGNYSLYNCCCRRNWGSRTDAGLTANTVESYGRTCVVQLEESTNDAYSQKDSSLKSIHHTVDCCLHRQKPRLSVSTKGHELQGRRRRIEQAQHAFDFRLVPRTFNSLFERGNQPCRHQRLSSGRRRRSWSTPFTTVPMRVGEKIEVKRLGTHPPRSRRAPAHSPNAMMRLGCLPVLFPRETSVVCERRAVGLPSTSPAQQLESFVCRFALLRATMIRGASQRAGVSLSHTSSSSAFL